MAGENRGGGSNGAASQTENGDDSMLRIGYRLPPPEIRDIVDALPPIPALSFSPRMNKIAFGKRRALRPLAELARPEEKLAGIRIDGMCNTEGFTSFHTAVRIHQLRPDGTLGLGKELHGYPDGAKINSISWLPDGRHLAFTVRIDEEENDRGKLRVWVADVKTGKARPLFQSPDIYLNAVFLGYLFVDNSTLLVSTIPSSRGCLPKKPFVPKGPKIQSKEHKNVIQVRTFQDLLKDEYDEDLFDYYATSQLVLASLDGRVKKIGPPAVYASMSPSPDGKYLLISSIHRPYSYIVPCERFPAKVYLWTADGKFVRELCDSPTAFKNIRKGMRCISWRADKPSTLYWVETQDGGDANVEVSPRDIIYTQPAEPLEGEQPAILHQLDLRYGGVTWCDDSLALVYESCYKTRRTRTWVIAPGSKDASPRILFDRSSEDVYSDPGSPMLRHTPAATQVIAKVKKENDENTNILLKGRGATPEGNVPFVDLLNINTGCKERIWQCDKEKYYETVVALICDQKKGHLRLEQLKILTLKESNTEYSQLHILRWQEQACQITNWPHPYPQLASLQKETIRYLRVDGEQLTATLYLPPGYDPSKEDPLPCFVWCDPDEIRVSPNEFAGMGPTSPLLWLARRFAILYRPTLPIDGKGFRRDKKANDRYIEQMVRSAEAAVVEVVLRGVAHPDKIAVGGHSCGAFMTANLLAHAPHLFCCGVAYSAGDYRTLTPFGFQNEDGTLWEMNPFMSDNKIKKPILLIHGEEDNIPGSLTTQSEHFLRALKDHDDVPCRLVILPFENHVYSARESIMHVLWETDKWLQKYCVLNNSDVNVDFDVSN